MGQLTLTLVKWTYLLKTQTPEYTKKTEEIMQIHIDDKMSADFQIIIYNRKISTLWDTRASKSVISEKCLQKIYYTDKVYPYTGITLSSASGSSISILTLTTGLGAHKFKQNFIVCRNLKDH